MYCQKCGEQNDDNAYKCTKCGEPLAHEEQRTAQEQQKIQSRARAIPNYLAQAIIVTIICFWPTGIPAIVNAARVNNKLIQGDFIGASECSDKAKMWSWISFGIGIGVILLFGIMPFVCAGFLY